jgi:regulator of sigma D
MTATQIFTVFAGILALIGAYFYFIGIDPETKRELERKALKTMGENKMSYMAKGTITYDVVLLQTNTFQTKSTSFRPPIRRT